MVSLRIIALFALLMVGCRSFNIPTYLQPPSIANQLKPEEGSGGKLAWIDKFPPKTQKTIKIVGAGAAVCTVLFVLLRFKWLSGLLGGIVFAAITTFSVAATILPLLPVILPIAAGFLILKVIWALFNDDDDEDVSKAKRR